MCFTVDNIDDLKRICTNINSILDEHCDGDLMLSQKIMLGENIKDFVDNPIVKNSGLLPKE